jgi:predicted Zn-ribbon and HTH transcriptional regulator
MIKPWSLPSSIAKWTLEGFPVSSKDIFDERLNLCKSCDEWDENGFSGTGKCKKCGCSTQAKLRMATSKCPIGKWNAVEKTLE